MAQKAPSADSDKSSEQIQCELAASCAQTPADSETTVADADPAAGDATPTADGATATDSELTRSWTWGQTNGANPVRAVPAREYGPSAASLAPRTNRTAQVTATRRIRAAVQPVSNRTSLAIGFVQGSAAFTEAGQRQADKVYRALAVGDFSQKHYLIGGYTDSAGDAGLNLDLSRRQAQALADYLVTKGMPRESFRVRGYGGADAKHVAVVAGASGRRVEITKLD